jgi:molecular chaperone DnaK (HSP70)
MDTAHQVLRSAGVSKGDISEIVFIGGSTRITKFNHFFKNFSMTNNHAEELIQMKQLHMVQQFK